MPCSNLDSAGLLSSNLEHSDGGCTGPGPGPPLPSPSSSCTVSGLSHPYGQILSLLPTEGQPLVSEMGILVAQAVLRQWTWELRALSRSCAPGMWSGGGEHRVDHLVGLRLSPHEIKVKAGWRRARERGP